MALPICSDFFFYEGFLLQAFNCHEMTVAELKENKNSRKQGYPQKHIFTNTRLFLKAALL